ncbi:MAG: lipopolysaccharide biosynthesis protein [Desulfobacteraceae bacterium]|jgi:O-antigen/teichoic acid export membrane protein
MSLGRQIASATFQLSLSRLIVRSISLVTMPVLTRLLSPDAYGTSAMAGTMISLISVVTLVGMDMSYARAYYSQSSPSGETVELFVWRFAIGSALLTASIFAIIWSLFISKKMALPSYLSSLLGIGILLCITNSMAKTRARLNNRYRAMAISNVIAGLVAAGVSLGVALWWRRNELPLILSMVIVYLVPVIVLGIPNLGKLLQKSKLNKEEKLKIIKIGIAGSVTAPMYWVLSSLDRWFIGYFESTASVGIYSMGCNVGIMGMVVNNAVNSVWLTEASKLYETEPNNARIQLGRLAELLITGYAIVWLAITAAGGDVIRLLASSKFHTACEVVPYIAAGVFFYGIYHLATTSLLLMKSLNYTLWWTLGGGGVSVLLNLIIVPELGRFGAAICQTISFAVIGSGVLYSAQKKYPLMLNWKRLILTILIVVFLGNIMHGNWSSSPAISLMLKFPIGLAIAFTIIWFVSPNTVKIITNFPVINIVSRK